MQALNLQIVDHGRKRVKYHANMTWYSIAKPLLKKQGKTYEDVAPYLGVSKSAVGHYFTGKREVSVVQLQKIAKYLGVTVSVLLGEAPLDSENERLMLEVFRAIPYALQAVWLQTGRSLVTAGSNIVPWPNERRKNLDRRHLSSVPIGEDGRGQDRRKSA